MRLAGRPPGKLFFLFGDEEDLAEVHDGEARFGFGADLEGEGAGFGEGELADVAFDEVLEMFGGLHGHGVCLAGSDEMNFGTATVGAAALKNFDAVDSRFGKVKVPAHPVFKFRPVADGVFVGLGFITDGGAMDGDIASMQENRAVSVGLNEPGFGNWLLFCAGEAQSDNPRQKIKMPPH